MISGSPVFDGLVVFTLSADFSQATLSLKARAAFVNTKTGQTHGWTDGDGSMWSRNSMQKLAELRAALEDDLANRHFGGSVHEEAARAAPVVPPSGGLGEHLNSQGDTTPSV